MPDSNPSLRETAVPWAGVLAASPSQRPQHRIRRAMYMAFLALAVAVSLLGALAWEMESQRRADGQLLELTAEQRLLALQVGHQAVLLQRDAASRSEVLGALRSLVQDSARWSPGLDSGLALQSARSSADAQALALAVDQWKAARQRMADRASALIGQFTADPPVDISVAAGSLSAEAASAAALAQSLASHLQRQADDRASALNRRLLLGMAAVLVLLGVLSLAVVEPTAKGIRRDLELQMEQAKEVRMLALVAEHTTAAVVITDVEDRICWVNPAFTLLTGWPLSEALGARPLELLQSKGVGDSSMAQLHDAMVRGAGFRDVFLNRTRQGREICLDVDLRPLHDASGHVAGYVSVSTDITQRTAQQAKLQTLWNILPAGVVVFGADGSVQEANREAEKLLGLSLAQMQRQAPIPEAWRLLQENGQDVAVSDLASMRTLDTGVPLRDQTMGVRLPNGDLRWLLVSTEALQVNNGRVMAVVACLSDVTERRRLQDQLHLSARTDELTRLPNRAAVVDRLHKAIAHGARHPGYGFALLFMDFDRFKQVNDTLGHSAGDELLRQIASRLQVALRPGDQLARLEPLDAGDGELAARLGGDEFVVVLEGVNTEGAVAAVADRVLQEVSEPYLIGTTPLHSSASIGVVLHLGTTDSQLPPPTPEEVLRNADTAMYEAKRAGRGRWVMFNDSMHDRLVRALAMEADLRLALQRDELFVVYQPVVDLATRAVMGVEALARWRHPGRGLVPPVEFIPVAEEAGLIDALGNLVLRKACEEFVAWRADLGERAPPLLAVNLSRAQLKRPGMVQELSALLEEVGMQPDWLQLEVTESLAAQDEPVQATLRLLKSLGLKLALDDFGTGYSSLACLHQLPVDTVKVDRSFVMHAETVEYHRVLIEATVRVARTLGMTTVAEGIETEGQAQLMQKLNCSRGQGYLFSKPLDSRALRTLLAAEFETTL